MGTNSWFGIRSAMLWAAVPAMTMILDDGGGSPLFISDGDTHNLSITALGTNYNTGVFPEGSQVRVTAFLVSLNGVPIPHGEETLVLLQDDLYTPPPGEIHDKDALLELFEAGTTKTTFSIPEGYAIIVLRLDVLDATGEPFSQETLPNRDTLVLNKLSIWKGDPDEDPVVDINDASAFLGMQVQTNLATTYHPTSRTPFGQSHETYLTMSAHGFEAVYPKYADGVIDINTKAQLLPEPDDREVSGIHWVMNKLRIVNSPVHEHDVVRKTDLDALWLEVRKQGLVTNAFSGDDKVRVDVCLTEFGVADNTTVAFENPGLFRYSITEFAYTSGASGEGFQVDDANNYAAGSTSSPATLIPNTYYRWRVLVTGTDAGNPTTDFQLLEMS